MKKEWRRKMEDIKEKTKPKIEEDKIILRKVRRADEEVRRRERMKIG